MLDLDHTSVEVSCPACGFELEIQLLDVRTQVWRWCPCCRARIRLLEPDGSMSVGLARAEDAFRDLGKTMKKLFK